MKVILMKTLKFSKTYYILVGKIKKIDTEMYRFEIMVE